MLARTPTHPAAGGAQRRVPSQTSLTSHTPPRCSRHSASRSSPSSWRARRSRPTCRSERSRATATGSRGATSRTFASRRRTHRCAARALTTAGGGTPRTGPSPRSARPASGARPARARGGVGRRRRARDAAQRRRAARGRDARLCGRAPEDARLGGEVLGEPRRDEGVAREVWRGVDAERRRRHRLLKDKGKESAAGGSAREGEVCVGRVPPRGCRSVYK